MTGSDRLSVGGWALCAVMAIGLGVQGTLLYQAQAEHTRLIEKAAKAEDAARAAINGRFRAEDQLRQLEHDTDVAKALALNDLEEKLRAELGACKP